MIVHVVWEICVLCDSFAPLQQLIERPVRVEPERRSGSAGGKERLKDCLVWIDAAF
jgi:hypothetical protein